MLEAALNYARAGWPVFPVDSRTKRPKTWHGHLDATTDERQIRAWEPAYERHGAIATPTGSGLLVIDVDPRNGGSIPTWAPPTRTVKTQSGGWHLHYAIDQDLRSRAGLFGPGVDAKGAGGYVLLPPSPGYVWADMRPRTRVMRAVLLSYARPESRERTGQARLAPERWQRGIIHDQVVAWAAYFASTLEDDAEVHDAVWAMVERARAAGVRIDNARGHIDTAIRWVLQREASGIHTTSLPL